MRSGHAGGSGTGTAAVQKEYSEADDSGWLLTEPGYVMAVSPEAGTSMTAGGSVTLTVSRGLDYGDTAQIPDVVGMTKNEAITALGKWADIQITEQQSSEVPAGQVISQDPSATSEDGDTAYGNPDETISIVVSSGNQAPADTTTTTDTYNRQCFHSRYGAAEHSCCKRRSMEMYADTEYSNWISGWCNSSGTYPGSKRRNNFYYKWLTERRLHSRITLDITGASGVSEGNIVCIRAELDGNYPAAWVIILLTFEKAE